MSVEQYLDAIPKAELHVHLEGSVRPATLLKLAQRNHFELPAQNVEELQNWFQFRDFPHFAEIFTAIARCVRTREDYELIVYEYAETLARQNVRYAEITFSPCIHGIAKGIPFDTYFAGLTAGRQRALDNFGVEINWIFDIVRDIAQEKGISKRADYTLKVALEGMRDGVVGLGLGGTEVGHPPEWFSSWFEQALAAGLHSVPHAGEIVGPESVWSALHLLQAERIGHGVRSIEDPELVTYLADQHIPLEVNPTSNICIGVYSSYRQHPLPQLIAAGIPITINSDDPPLFNTTLNREVNLLYNTFKLDLPTIDQILLNGIRYSFLPTERKQVLEVEFQSQMHTLHKQFISSDK